MLPLKIYARKPPLQRFIFRIFDGLAEQPTSRYYDRFIEIKAFFHCHFLRNKVGDPHFFFQFWSK